MISLDSVSKRFGGFAAVEGISLTIAKGECFALLGPNGAGKTTIVRLLLDFIKPSSGTVRIDGIPAADPDSRKNVGYLAEDHRIPPYLSGLEYLKRHAALIGLSGKAVAMETERVLEAVSMNRAATKRSADYSKGMRQRIGLAAAMLGRPKLLILDEPTGGLDPVGIRDVRRIIVALNGSGVTVMLNSHLLSEVEKSCRTAAILHNGRILVKDSIDSITKGSETLEDIFFRYLEGQNE